MNTENYINEVDMSKSKGGGGRQGSTGGNSVSLQGTEKQVALPKKLLQVPKTTGKD